MQVGKLSAYMKGHTNEILKKRGVCISLEVEAMAYGQG